jgi:hypothetical protein
MQDYTYPLEFYLNYPLQTIDINGNGLIPQRPFILYTPTENLENLRKLKGWQFDTVANYNRYWITRLVPPFLNKATRAGTLGHVSVVIVR